ncbi:MAG: hypothetical protein IJ601_11820 [Acidaminococcaceae bacterium]|nr:hypothetical protein [Acidaminococcaceae bacterium]
MRCDLNIIWVEDTESFFKENSEILRMQAEELGLNIAIEYIQDAQNLFEKIEKSASGFRLYDMLFVDYSLSNGYEGDTVIKELRKKELDADILFYSSQMESEMRSKITADLKSFQGVYIANREDFLDRAFSLIHKNAKRLLSLKNIRGMLMDQTSENDYTIISYIMRRFGDLSDVQKQCICDMVKKSICKHLEKFEHSHKQLDQLEAGGITNIKKILKLPSYLLPITLKYQIFEKMVVFLQEKSFSDDSLKMYMSDIIEKRNLLAHKKLEVSNDQRYIIGFNNIDEYQTVQFQNQKIQSDVVPTGVKQISYNEWISLRKQIVEIGMCFDDIQKKL